MTESEVDKVKQKLKNINTDDEVDEMLELLDGMVYLEMPDQIDGLRDSIEGGYVTHWDVHTDVNNQTIITTIEIETPHQRLIS